MLTPKCVTEALEMWMLWHDLVSPQFFPQDGLLVNNPSSYRRVMLRGSKHRSLRSLLLKGDRL